MFFVPLTVALISGVVLALFFWPPKTPEKLEAGVKAEPAPVH
jgi:hypothetical protein